MASPAPAGLADYDDLDGLGLARLVSTGEAHPRELVDAAIARIERRDPAVNAVTRPLFDEARRRADGPLPDGPFRGVPFLLKDLGVDYAGTPTTAGSRARRDRIAGTHSELVERYLAAGLIVVGKTNVPELGLAPTTEPELHGPTRSPWDPERTAGGSSGGSAAAVAARMVPMAHASDGGGSIRIPASACGLFGLKPTRGRTPPAPDPGESWFGLSVDHAVTRTVRDSAALLDATLGGWPGAPYAAPPPGGPFLDEVGRDPGRLRIALCTEPLMGETMDPACARAAEEAAELCEALGHRVEPAAPPIHRQALTEAFLQLVAADTARQLADDVRASGPAPAREDYELTTRFTAAVGRVLGADRLAAAWAEMRRTGRAMAGFHRHHDVLLTPTLGRPPWTLGELAPSPAERRVLAALCRAPVRPAVLAAFRRMSEDLLEPIPNTPLFNLTGQPAASVPLGQTAEGMPVGVQIAAAFGEEATLFRLAAQLEVAQPWASRRPPAVE